ncbi:peptide-methionine (S)-S-oxide reductase MsrA [Dyella subtropica]|uniref:peptide-methionine (S)-S-oxide reductase MsrA n=1 Tax=Dyella subtropica TaxID=2992127 RepID=UPI0022523187|nr:peptide-methionine (S)-S-oxide reductase MsrA [Dyella subtropica]
MTTIRHRPLRALMGMLTLAGVSACGLSAASAAVALPPPALDAANAASHGEQTAVLAGGCFWGVESVFEHVKGVKKVWAGYAGGNGDTAHYELVGTGNTGHAESVKIVYDPAQVSYGQLLRVFFSVATDPTELNRQGPDVGTQYRSAIFYNNDEQKRIATAYIDQLTKAKAFTDPIVTQIAPLKAFYTAEAYHQNYARLHPNEPYIIFNDAPKVTNLKRLFPTMYKPEETVVDVQLH